MSARYWATVKYKNETSSRRVFDQIFEERDEMQVLWDKIKADKNVESAELKVDAGHIVDWISASTDNILHQPGRPPRYPARRRTTWEMSSELLDEIDRRRGSESRAIYVEQELRKLYGIAPLEELAK